MFLFENDKCPVCEKEFNQGDDVVVCPECGTPHHRECYDSAKGCANKKLHNTDFKFQRSAVQEIQEPQAEENTDLPQPSLFASFSDADKTDEVNRLVNENLSEEENSEEVQIDGVSVYDASNVIRVNINYYLPRFLKNKGLNWNWGAFFFGQFYYFFRKMYLEGFMFSVFNFGINLLVEKFFSKTLLKYINGFEARLADLSPVFSSRIANMSAESKEMFDSLLITGIISLIISAVMAIFANRLYKKKVISTVKTVDEKLKNGGTFAVNPLMMGEDVNLSKEDMRKLFLAKQGGVTWVVPALIYLAVMLLTQLQI